MLSLTVSNVYLDLSITTCHLQACEHFEWVSSMHRVGVLPGHVVQLAIVHAEACGTIFQFSWPRQSVRPSDWHRVALFPILCCNMSSTCWLTVPCWCIGTLLGACLIGGLQYQSGAARYLSVQGLTCLMRRHLWTQASKFFPLCDAQVHGARFKLIVFIYNIIRRSIIFRLTETRLK